MPHGDATDMQRPVSPVHPQLRGDLPCLGCRYNLRGLSVRSSCPECGLPVRATVLAVVDPHAAELVPLSRPRLTCAGLMLWSVGALVAVLACWLSLVASSSQTFGNETATFNAISIWAIAASGIGATAFIRPHRETPRLESLMAIGGVLAYLPLLAAFWRLREQIDPVAGPAYFSGIGVIVGRTLTRMVITVSAIAVLLGIRRSARSLVSRSLLMRTGRVDRQTVLATVAALAITLIGDLVHLLSVEKFGLLSDNSAEVAELCGTILILVGSALTTLAMVGVVIDAVRLRPAIVSQPFGFDDVLAFRADEEERKP